jgi:2-polyprenyl-3-methyl-5-hydroxy-6-metoxy-1,4-benzoquinol methylase
MGKSKLFLNKLHILIYKSTAWMKEINNCQNEILFQSRHPHYIAAYKNEEISYWLHIPKWIYERRQVKRINKCLDIGCAYGTLALFCKRVLNCEVYCTDFGDTYINRALIEKYNFNFQINNIELDEFPWDFVFDIIVFTEILEHLNFHPLATLRKLHSLLADDGVLYLSTPDSSQWGRVTKYYPDLESMPKPQAGMPVVDDHVYQYEKDELLHLFSSAGFKIINFSYAPGVLNRHFNFELIKQRG